VSARARYVAGHGSRQTASRGHNSPELVIDLPESWRIILQRTVEVENRSTVIPLNRDTSMQIFARLCKIMCFVAIVSLQSLAHAGQSGIVTAEMKAGESDQQFVQRIVKGDVIGTQIARTSKLLEDKREVLLAFTMPPIDEKKLQLDPSDDMDISLNVFIKHNAQSYVYLQPVVACEVEGGQADLRAFFYVNVAGEPRPLLGIICGWDAPHAMSCNLPDEVRLYKISDDGILEVPMDKYRAALYSKEPSEGVPTDDCTVSNFQTAADVKRLLSKFKTKAQPHP
jgi:hypothetical protein